MCLDELIVCVVSFPEGPRFLYCGAGLVTQRRIIRILPTVLCNGIYGLVVLRADEVKKYLVYREG